MPFEQTGDNACAVFHGPYNDITTNVTNVYTNSSMLIKLNS